MTNEMEFRNGDVTFEPTPVSLNADHHHADLPPPIKEVNMSRSTATGHHNHNHNGTSTTTCGSSISNNSSNGTCSATNTASNISTVSSATSSSTTSSSSSVITNGHTNNISGQKSGKHGSVKSKSGAANGTPSNGNSAKNVSSERSSHNNGGHFGKRGERNSERNSQHQTTRPVRQSTYKQSININDPNDWPALGEPAVNGIDKIARSTGKAAPEQLIETTVLEETKSFSKLVISKTPVAAIATNGNAISLTRDRNNNNQPSLTNGDDHKPALNGLTNGCSASSSEEEKDTSSVNGSADGSTSAAQQSKNKKKGSKGKWKPLQIETFTPRAAAERRRMERSRETREQREPRELREQREPRNTQQTLSQSQNMQQQNSSQQSSNASTSNRNRRKETTNSEPLLNGPLLPKLPTMKQSPVLSVAPVLINPPVLPQLTNGILNGFSQLNGEQKSSISESDDARTAKAVPLVNGLPTVSSTAVSSASTSASAATTATVTSSNGSSRQRRNNSSRVARNVRSNVVTGVNYRPRTTGRMHYDSGNVTPISDYENAFFLDMAQAVSTPAVGYGSPFFFQPVPRLSPEALDKCIRTQIEYYFSEENLHGDLFLRRKMDKLGYLPISLIASFYRVQALTKNVLQIVEALKKSEKVEMSECMTKVRTRVQPERWPLFDQRFTITSVQPAPFTNGTVNGSTNADTNGEDHSKSAVNENGITSAENAGAESAPNQMHPTTLHTDLHPNVPVFLPGQPYGYGYDGANTGEFVPPPPAMLCLSKNTSHMYHYPTVPPRLLQPYTSVPLLKSPGGRRIPRKERDQQQRDSQSGQQQTRQHQQPQLTAQTSTNSEPVSNSSQSSSVSSEPTSKQNSEAKVLSYSDAIKLKEKAANTTTPTTSADKNLNKKKGASSNAVETVPTETVSVNDVNKSNKNDSSKLNEEIGVTKSSELDDAGDRPINAVIQ